MSDKAIRKVGGKFNPTYSSWRNMRYRCQNPNRPFYKDYGGRGITVCDRWDTYENFLEDMGERPPGTSLDRIDSNKGYSPENCRWATPSEQCANRRPVQEYEYHGLIMSLKEWSDFFGVSFGRVRTLIWRFKDPYIAFDRF